MDVQIIISNIFVISGAIAVVLFTVWLLIRMYVLRKYIRTSAEIISLKKGEIKVSSTYPPIKTETPVLRYIVNETVVESSNLQPALEEEHRYVVGQTIDIIYHPAKPHKHAHADNFHSRHYVPISGIMFGTGSVIFGIIFRFLVF